LANLLGLLWLGLHVESKLGSPGENTGVSDFVDNEFLNDITLVHINGNNGDDLDTEFSAKVLSDTLNQGNNSADSNVEVFLHSGFRATVFELLEGTLSLFSPDDLGSEEGNLSVLVIEPNVASLRKIPVFGGLLGGVKDFFESGLHLGFKVAEIVLDGASADEFSVEGNVLLTVLRVHTKGGLEGLGAFQLEFEVTETIETVTNLLIDLNGVVTVGKDVEQGLVGQEVEPRENLLLFFKISVKGFLTSLNV